MHEDDDNNVDDIGDDDDDVDDIGHVYEVC